MADNALVAFQEAETALRTGKYPEALGGYLQVLRATPRFWRARFRVGDTLLNLGARDEALEVYESIAWHAIKDGHPLQGLVATKMALAIDPSLTDIIDILAQLYSKESDRVGDISEERSRVLPTEQDAVQPLEGLEGRALVETAAREASDTEAIADYPETLPSIPLFSFLDEDAFLSVLARLQLRRYVKDQRVIQEGQPGDSFFILAEGDVEVTRRVGERNVRLAMLHHGAVFGEMALISKAPRTATVTATDDCDLLELKRATLEDEAHKLASVTHALKEFTHDRFLANLTATSPIFKAFPHHVRTEIIKRFQDFPIDPGDELIGEGEEGQGLFLILKGTVEVTKRSEGSGSIKLAELKEGDVFGEISLIQDSPTTATCAARTRGELLFLPKPEFASLVTQHPEIKDELSKITAERIQKTKKMLDPEEYELVEDDDLIML